MTDIHSDSGTSQEDLAQLFGAYLHQDWDLFGDEPWDAVRAFRTEEPETVVRAAADKVRQICRQSSSEASLKSVIRQLGIEYNPEFHGWSYYGWLTELEKMLRFEE